MDKRFAPIQGHRGLTTLPGKTPKSPATQKLANTTLLIGYDSENRCIHVNLLENAKDGDWNLVSIRNQKYRKLGVRKLSVLMFGANGQIINQFYDEASPPKKEK
jgi:hypothetical protein